jgi:hypothetical protein
MIKRVFVMILPGLLAAPAAIAEENPKVTLYRNPNRGFCPNYVAYLHNAGTSWAVMRR